MSLSADAPVNRTPSFPWSPREVESDEGRLEAVYDELRRIQRGSGTRYVYLGGRLWEFRIETWDSNCIIDYAERRGRPIDLDGDEDDVEGDMWDELWTAIEEIKREEDWDEVIYVPPEISGESYGATIWLRDLSSA